MLNIIMDIYVNVYAYLMVLGVIFMLPKGNNSRELCRQINKITKLKVLHVPPITSHTQNLKS